MRRRQGARVDAGVMRISGGGEQGLLELQAFGEGNVATGGQQANQNYAGAG